MKGTKVEKIKVEEDVWGQSTYFTGAAWSAYEHLVPEQIFSTDENPVEGVSAVKALAIASQAGQRIYTITQENRATAINALTIDQTVINEINTAVQSGMEVTVSQNNINYAGWNGVGYIITDPETGAGAYKISGGANGGEAALNTEILKVFGFIALATGLTALTVAVITLSLIYFAIIVKTILYLSVIDLAVSTYQVTQRCDQLTALSTILAMATFETVIKLGRFKDWIEAIVFGIQKTTAPEPCSV